MVYKEHFIELWINGSKVELEDQKSLNMRFNNVITDPTKISSNQAEYSFEFEIPATPKNNVILDYANNLGKLNKFHQRYNAEVYADGTVIFSGTITINGFKENKYQLNLVSVKVYSLDEIFGDATMDKIKLPNGDKWSIPFDGVDTINEVNAMDSTEVTFPFISYGVFQKSPYSSDEVASDYTSKYDLDKWARFYVESFPPSHNMLATLRRAFEWKGKKVGGDAFADERLKKIYMSDNYADGQSPLYNVGNPRFGSVDLSTTFTTKRTASTNNVGYQQDLNFPYYRVSGKDQDYYNFKAVDIYNLLSGTVTVNQDVCYMYQPEENLIVVPADGFYKIELSADVTLNTGITSTLTAAQYTRSYLDDNPEEVDLALTPSLDEITPIEIALIKNYDDNYELIKGKNNRLYGNGNPNDETYEIAQHRYAANAYDWYTCFPHEDPYNSMLPTEKNDLAFRNTKSYQDTMGGQRGSSDSGRMGGQRTRGGTIEERDRNTSSFEGQRWYKSQGYVYADGEIMCYDQAVSEAFVCGFSSMRGGVISVMKNGYSWSKSNATQNQAFYPEIGYLKVSDTQREGITTEETNFNSNIYINTPVSYLNVSDTKLRGYVSCMVYLHRNDRLNLVAVQREYHDTYSNDVTYSTTSNVTFKMSAASPRSYDQLKADHFEYYSQTEFDVNLNLANFFNKEKKVSDWIQNVLDAYNLELIQNGNNVDINIKKKPNLMTAVDLDDRCNYSEAEAKAIDYPKSMAIKYKIDDDEWGFERSAVKAAGGDESILNNDDWKKYADSGYTTIQLNDDSYVTSTSDKNLQFSYTWYDTFHWYSVDNTFTTQGSTPVNIQIPVISKFTYMIDGYNYEESMKHDGYGLAQRFWFKPTQTPFYVWTRTYPAERVTLYLPSNTYNKLKLNYKDVEGSLLNSFFNVNAYLASNYVIIDVYLSADEYNRIKNGALVHFDSDLYIPVEVSGYDPSGNNATTLKLMKKVA